MNQVEELIAEMDGKVLGVGPHDAYHGVAYKDEFLISNNTACCMGLKSFDSGVEYVVSYILKKRLKKGEEKKAEAFLHWLLNESPYSESFVTKDAKEALSTSFLVSDANTPDNILVGGLISLRALTEVCMVQISTTWYELAKAGVDKNLAFLLGFMVRIDTAGAMYNNCGGHHSAIHPSYMTKEAASNFINDRPKVVNDSYHETGSFSYIHDTWGGDGGSSEFRDCMKEWQYTGEVKKSSKVNPFERAVAEDNGRYFNVEKLVEHYVVNQEQIMKELAA
jgi:hypothetical protein